jgi:serine/threonine-protein kinase
MTPFVATNAYELLHKISREDAPPVRHFAPGVDPQFAAIVDRALIRDPEQRYADATEFLAVLEAWNDGAMELPPLRTPRGSIPPPMHPPPAQAALPLAPQAAPMPSRAAPSMPRPRSERGRAALMVAIFVAAAAGATALQLSSTTVKHANGGLALIGVEVASTLPPPTTQSTASSAEPEPLDETLGPPAEGVVPVPAPADGLQSDLVEPPPPPPVAAPARTHRANPQAPVVGDVEF